jgi:hypothetical protein
LNYITHFDIIQVLNKILTQGNTMKIYFGNANEDIFSDGLFTVGENQFYYGVEHGTGPGGLDEVRIFDGCNRYLPIHLEGIPELIAALQEIQRIGEAVKRAKEMTERAESNIEGYVTQAWHDEFEVDFDTVE